MSHFYVWAIVPITVPMSEVEDYIEERMERYNEQREVDEHPEKCHCVGYAAENRARDKAQEVTGGIPEIRAKFQRDPAVVVLTRRENELYRKSTLTKEEKKELQALDKESERLWKIAIAPYQEAEKQALEADPDKDKPDPECEDCRGKGMVSSTANPEGKWDWYRIGGRWDGAIQHRDPQSADGGFNFDKKHQMVTGNYRWISEMPAEIPDEDIPFAILTPEGEWAEKGRMGWFGCVHDESEDWKDQARKVVEKYRHGYIAVGLDCHV